MTNATRVACQALARPRGDVRAVFERGLARLIRVGQYCGIDVDHDLIAGAGRAGIQLVPKRRLGDHADGIGLLLLIAGTIAVRPVHASLGVRPVVGGIERLPQHGTDLWGQPAAYHEHALVVLVNLQGPAPPAVHGQLVLGGAIDAPPRGRDAFDVSGRTVPREHQQAFLDLRRSHPGQRSHLGVGDGSAGEGLSDVGQVGEREFSQWAHERKPLAQPLRASNPG